MNLPLKHYLDELYLSFSDDYLFSDPISLVKKYKHPEDQEIAAWIMSALAFGQVSQILKAGKCALNLMNHQPRKYIDSFDPEKEARKWKNFYYRMIRDSDMLRWFSVMKIILKRNGSIHHWMLKHYEPEDEHLGMMWARAVKEIKSVDEKRWKGIRSGGVGFRHLFPDPSKQGACKRAFLLLRWMVRRDAVDFGLWADLPKNKLLIPLDTHMLWTARQIGLTRRNDNRLQTAVEITGRLSDLDPDDPVKYDFALTRLGILKLCGKRYDPEKCPACPIGKYCEAKKISGRRVS